MKARKNVTIFVMMTGMEFIANPYSTQRKMPVQNMTNMPVEISFVDRVFQGLITWGTKDIVVNIPAAMPSNVT